ncbi:dihydrodipicolinate synthase family protein [Croceicoccus bisphenolivorans]|uniref:dihydrodipicolinate synthase family protein n=1 Tax=Croceicoccus bisphenolivorans TaxID=1783232 RepID=UPI00082B4171|nr:dihydrodipicolinate synthase family protein [Croceicoccus bisphenolivorans]
MSLPTYSGIITVLTTPFDANNVIDYDVLGRHIDWLIENGVTSILQGGSTGEYYAMTMEERREALAFVAKHVAGRAQLIAGTNAMRPDDTLELNDYVKDLGYEAVMLAAPPYAAPSAEELAAHFRRIAAATDLGIILYNMPSRTAVDMGPDFLDGVRGIDNIHAIKESSGSMSRHYEHVVNYPHLQRVCGMDDQALDIFLWGAKSWIAGASNFLPAEHVALWKAAVEKRDILLGLKIMQGMMPLIYLLENGGKYIQYVKYGTELAGFDVGPMRAPMGGLTDAEKTHFEKLYDDVKALDLAALVA